MKGATNPDIICGLSAQNAEMVVNANPGSVFSIQWSGGDGVSKVSVAPVRIQSTLTRRSGHTTRVRS